MLIKNIGFLLKYCIFFYEQNEEKAKEMKNYLVSVIVPIYRVEQYLDRCVSSIVNQTYKNIEIILVNDGSPDNCPKICDEWAKKDKRIKVIHKQNGGLSDARNSGLDKATGKYVLFVDSDDYIENNMVEELLNSLNKEDADIAICNYYIENDIEKHVANNLLMEKFVCSGNEKYKMNFDEKYSIQSIVAWNKLYKIELFNGIRYPKGKIHEDEYIICDILEKANKIVYNLKPLYHYIQRDNSITSCFKFNRFDIEYALDRRIDFFQNRKMFYYVYKTRQLEIAVLKSLIERAISSDKRNIFNTNIISHCYKIKNISKKVINSEYFLEEDRNYIKSIKKLSKGPLNYILVNKLRKKISLLGK